MTSTSSVGSTNIGLTFGLGRSLDGAARDVQAALVAAHRPAIRDDEKSLLSQAQ